MAIPILSVPQMREWENQTWASGQSQAAVIQRAGEQVAQIAASIIPPAAPLLVLAGRGHNGDDARVAASQFSKERVTLLEVADPAQALPQVQAWLQSRQARTGWVIDGLFGIGLNRPLAADWVQLIETLNNSETPILAVDVPSGLHAETGEPMGAAVKATVTVTLGAPKTGLLLSSAVEYIGRLEVAPNIGLIPCPFQTDRQWIVPAEDFLGFPPRRPIMGHKGKFGHLCIVAGSLGYHGAAVLAARGSLRAQPGLVTLIVPPDVYVPIASQLRSAMVHPWAAGMWEDAEFSAVLFGPGLANYDLPEELKREVCRVWLESPLPVVADASALSWLPPGPTCPEALRIITPHPGEAARMLGRGVPEVQANRPLALRELSAKWGGCWVVLKGNRTLIGQATGPLYVNPSGNPHLAQGGSGDLLAGFLAGYIAQPPLQADPSLTIRYAAWRHGAAADSLSQRFSNWTIDELEAELAGGTP